MKKVTINVDASYHDDSGITSYGIVLKGKHTKTSSYLFYGFLKNSRNSVEAELRALRIALQKARKLSFTHVTVQIDCSSILRLLQRVETTKWREYERLVKDINTLLKSPCFESCELVTDVRSENKRAHNLAYRANRGRRAGMKSDELTAYVLDGYIEHTRGEKFHKMNRLEGELKQARDSLPVIKPSRREQKKALIESIKRELEALRSIKAS